MNTNKSRKTKCNEERISPKESSANEITVKKKVEVNTTQQMWEKAAKRHINASEDEGHYVDIQGGDVNKDAIDTANTRPCRVNGIKEYNLSDETVLYCPVREIAHSLNSSAKAIWELCDGSNSIVEIIQKLSKRFGCSGTDLLPDVTTAVIKLQKLSLLELKNAPNTKST